jgi:hypothetical protein
MVARSRMSAGSDSELKSIPAIAAMVRDCDGESMYSSEIEVIEFDPTIKGIIKMLNQYADHPNNG